MMRRARGAWCGGFTTPGQRCPCVPPWSARLSLLSNAARASAPSPAPERPRNARRVSTRCSESAGCMRFSLFFLERFHFFGFDNRLSALARPQDADDAEGTLGVKMLLRRLADDDDGTAAVLDRQGGLFAAAAVVLDLRGLARDVDLALAQRLVCTFVVEQTYRPFHAQLARFLH